MTSSESIRSGLLQLDAIERADRSAYDARLRALFETELSAWGRLRYLLPAVAGLVVAVGLTTLALSEPASTPLTTRATLLVLAGIGLVWFFLCGRVVLRRSVDVTTDGRRIAAAALLLTSAQVGFFAWRTWVDATVLPGLLLSLGLLVAAAALFVAQRVKASELRIREALLVARLEAAESPASGRDA